MASVRDIHPSTSLENLKRIRDRGYLSANGKIEYYPDSVDRMIEDRKSRLDQELIDCQIKQMDQYDVAMMKYEIDC